MIPDKRSSNGTPLFRKICPICGDEKYVDKRKLGTKCQLCTLKARSTHGLSKHPIYRVLKNIEARCYIPSASNYKYYGGRGIGVCDEWRKNPLLFVKWAEARGWEPGLEIDRKDANGDYSPGNCQVVTHEINSQRTRRIKITTTQVHEVKILLKTKGVREISNELNVPYMVIWHIKNKNSWRNA